MGGRRAWLVWGLAVVTYAVAIMQRTSLGIAGEEAAAHFDTTVAIISTFAMIQLAAYAAMQVPAGVLLDRFGPRAMIVLGSVVMGAGQMALAMTDELPVAFAARALVGIGDAFLFGSVLRLLPSWFAPGRVPLLTQLIGIIGQLGQLASLVAVLPMVRTWGWTTGIGVTASVSFAFAIFSGLVVRDSPTSEPRSTKTAGLTDLPRAVREVLHHPGTRLGFWVHFSAGFYFNMFVVMWGMPYLTIGQGRATATAGTLFSMATMGLVVFGPLIGQLTARYPGRRTALALSVILTNLVLWTAVLTWPGPAPTWLLVLLMLAISASAPATNIGFDFARTFLPHTRLGAANGVIITGGFIGATLCMLAIALLLQWMTGGQAASAQQMNLAMTTQLPFFGIGLSGIYLSHRQLTRWTKTQGA